MTTPAIHQAHCAEDLATVRERCRRRSFGFKDIERYPESEMGAGFEAHMVYMQRDL